VMAPRKYAVPTVRRTREVVLAVDQFVRLHLLFFTVVWPLLGAAASVRAISVRELSVLLGVAGCFHIFAYVLNDVIDLPIDRTHADRQRDLLVRGAVRPWQALMIALVQPFCAALLTMILGTASTANVTLLTGFACIFVYNLWGKRCPFPPLTDAIQGFGWASLTIYAAQALGTPANPLTWMVAAYAVGFTIFINGVHGGLRDLANDFAADARTTAIYFGARPGSDDDRSVHVPTPFAAYASGVLVVLVALNGVLMLRNDFGYGRFAWTMTAVAVGAINVYAVWLQRLVLYPRGSAADVAWRLQMYLMFLALPIAFVARAPVVVSIILAALNGMALLLWPSTAIVFRWIWRATCAVVRPGYQHRFAVDAAKPVSR
jgi:4-hydroxybenzoate polyprenyltransferase